MSRNHVVLIALCISLTGCLLESVAPIDRNIKPYGAHWVKDGMTRESRQVDLAACGANNAEKVEFTPGQIKAATLPTDKNEIAATLRLRADVGRCMSAKGYTPIGDLHFLGGCDARCLYP